MKLLPFSILILTLSTSLYAQPVARLARLAPVAKRLDARRLLCSTTKFNTSTLEERIKTLEDQIADLKKENADNQSQLRNLKKELEKEINNLRNDLRGQIPVFRPRSY